MYSDDLRNRLRVALASGSARDELISAGYGNPFGRVFYVDGVPGSGASDNHNGQSADRPFATMAKAFTVIGDGDTIFLRGGVYENLSTPAGVTDVTIVGASTKPRHDNLTVAAKIGGAAWRTASGVTDEPLLTIRGQGWRLANFLMAGPSASSCVTLLRDATYDPGHAILEGMRFVGGEHHILASGGPAFIGVYGNSFEGATVAAIGQVLGAGIGSHLSWRVEGNNFPSNHADYAGNASHILMNVAKAWVVKDNVFGTVTSTALYIDLNGVDGGGAHTVTGNTLGGVYTTADYVAGTGDLWLGNWVTVISTQAPNGFTILAPAA